MDRLYKYYIILITSFLVCSCVKDDGSFPEDSEIEITNTSIIVTIINNLQVGDLGINEDGLCFEFQYPITLGYNTGSNIKVNNFEGLVDIISGQSSNFNIEGIQFPVEIMLKGDDTKKLIKTEEDLLNIVIGCELDTLRDKFNELFVQCFRFSYPIALRNKNQEEIVINNEEDFGRFLEKQGSDYEPDFMFPVNIVEVSSLKSEEISTYYQFYQILNKCVGCPDFDVEVRSLGNDEYQFTIPNFEIENGFELSFLINGKVIPNAVIEQNSFIIRFSTPGVANEVCIKLITPDCQQGKMVCKEVVTDPICPELSFNYFIEPDTLIYDFIADFPEMNEISYDWLLDGEVIDENDGSGGDNIFTSILKPGIHKVCMRSALPLCQEEEIEFCRDVIVCPELFFTYVQHGMTNTYHFFANFPGIEYLSYNWVINDVVQEADGGLGGENEYSLEFTPGTYEVCISTVVEGCTGVLKFCVDISIP